ncbi:transposase [Amaricoccus sp.]|uniref:IS66-like element accessory protein TnpA n=1 Tax=Amaricoccus sp. TaxID=1872485 RepID=UPI002638C7CA|nr:transposase [Amaricoccus sp.]HRO13096.1 transposase [Amaricoccus sp.]
MAGDGKMDVHLDVSRNGYGVRLEVIEEPTGRRRRSASEKARIVAESLMPGVTVADVARRHGTTRWQVYDWRRRARDGRLVPAETSPSVAFAGVVVAEAQPASGADGSDIEVVVGDVMIRAAPDAGEAHLARVIRAARAAR